MNFQLIAVFVIVYGAIVFEHPLKINKSASALIGAGVLWTIYAMGSLDVQLVNQNLSSSLTSTAQIVFFLMGAMTIVEVIDAHNGFEVLTSRIKNTALVSLLIFVSFATFFLSAILDNLTTAIVMVSLTRKLLAEREDRLLFAGMIIIAANAGGAWTPIGDVTTTMLWIGGQITPLAIMKAMFLPSLINMIVPLFVLVYRLRGRDVVAPTLVNENLMETSPFERKLMFFAGLTILICVPIFKAVTHLPPFLGILLGLGLLWMLGDLVHQKKEEIHKESLTLVAALKRIDMSSIIFFVGILLAVATLEHAHILSALASKLDQILGRQSLIVMLIGIVSAIVDNVPLVAATMGMYSLTNFPVDSFLWEFLAYCAGTGGSILVIGSAAGVAAMGMEKIDFLWYLRKISGLALLGFFAGAAVYGLQLQLGL